MAHPRVWLPVALGAFAGCATVGGRAVGTYRACAIACETLVLRSDHTFSLALDGDLFDHLVTTGEWTQDGDRITLSGTNPCGPALEESIQGHPGNLRISVRTSGPLATELQLGATDGQTTITLEGNDVTVALLRPRQILAEGRWVGRCSWDVKNPDSDTFTVPLTPVDGPVVVYEEYILTRRGIVNASSWELVRQRQ